MILLGHEIPDELPVTAVALAGTVLGWFGRQSAAAHKRRVEDRAATVDEREVTVDERRAEIEVFNALARSHDREVRGLREDVQGLREEIKALRDKNSLLERENIDLLRKIGAQELRINKQDDEIAFLVGELKRLGHPSTQQLKLGRRKGETVDVIVVEPAVLPSDAASEPAES